MTFATVIAEAAQESSNSSTPRFPCLERNITLSDVVSASINGSSRVTVKDKLNVLKARCRKGKLVDVKGRQIRFYHLQGCWGNPPADYSEILDRQRNEIEKLKKRYTVIEMTCNPNGVLPQSISSRFP
jgi:hypothetical protein